MIPFPKRKFRYLGHDPEIPRLQERLAEKVAEKAWRELDRILHPHLEAHLAQEVRALTRHKDLALAEVALGLVRAAAALEEAALAYAREHGYSTEVAVAAAIKRLGVPALVYYQRFGGPKGKKEAEEFARRERELYFQYDFPEVERDIRLRQAAQGLQAEVVRRRCQEREEKPAYPVVRVWDEAGELLVEVFLGGFSMGNSVSRLLNDPPASWSQDRLLAARRLAVRAAVEECG